MATDLGPAWIALAGGLFGSAAGYLGTKATLKASAQQAADERHEARETARVTYAVETLLELQIVVHRAIRLCGRMNNWHMEMGDRGEPGALRGTPQYLAQGREYQRRVLAVDAAIILLASRVRDDEVRMGANIGRLAMLRLLRASNISRAGDLWEEARKELTAVQERIGELLRDLPPPVVFRPLVSEMWADDLDLSVSTQKGLHRPNGGIDGGGDGVDVDEARHAEPVVAEDIGDVLEGDA